MEKDGTYMGTKTDRVGSGQTRHTLYPSSNSGNLKTAVGVSLLKEKLSAFTSRLNHDPFEDAFDPSPEKVIECIRIFCDLKNMLFSIREKGSIILGVKSSSKLLESAIKLTNRASEISDTEIISL